MVITLKPVPMIKVAAAIQPSGVIIDTTPGPTSAKLMAWSDWQRDRQSQARICDYRRRGYALT